MVDSYFFLKCPECGFENAEGIFKPQNKTLDLSCTKCGFSHVHIEVSKSQRHKISRGIATYLYNQVCEMDKKVDDMIAAGSDATELKHITSNLKSDCTDALGYLNELIKDEKKK